MRLTRRFIGWVVSLRWLFIVSVLPPPIRGTFLAQSRYVSRRYGGVWRYFRMFARVVEQLAVTPDIVRAMMGHLSNAEADWKPAPQRFSITEVMAHLCDTETQVFRARLERMVNEDNPPLDAYDQEAIAAAGGYAGRNVE